MDICVYVCMYNNVCVYGMRSCICMGKLRIGNNISSGCTC